MNGIAPAVLTQETLLTGVDILARRDPDLAAVIGPFGPPPLWDRPQGFATLIYIILEQQVSLASARAAFTRLSAAIQPVSPLGFLSLEDDALKAIGFSRQKMRYGRILARAVLDGELNMAALPGLDDAGVRAELMRLKGIGRWSADIYLMEALLRPDVWPSGDLALAIAVRRVKRLPTTPNPAELHALGEVYQPWRAVAARIFWHYYLSANRNTQKP